MLDGGTARGVVRVQWEDDAADADGARAMERLRDAVFEQTGERFDSCLINWYDERAACAYHTDPGMGDDVRDGFRHRLHRRDAEV